MVRSMSLTPTGLPFWQITYAVCPLAQPNAALTAPSENRGEQAPSSKKCARICSLPVFFAAIQEPPYLSCRNNLRNAIHLDYTTLPAARQVFFTEKLCRLYKIARILAGRLSSAAA